MLFQDIKGLYQKKMGEEMNNLWNVKCVIKRENLWIQSPALKNRGLQMSLLIRMVMHAQCGFVM